MSLFRSLVRPSHLTFASIYGLAILTACASDDQVVLPDRCQPGIASLQSFPRQPRRTHQLTGVSFGKQHNDAVRELFARAREIKPTIESLEDAHDALIQAAGDVAQRHGLPRADLERSARVGIVLANDDLPPDSPLRASGNRFANRPDVAEQVSHFRAKKKQMGDLRAQRRHPRDAGGGAGVANLQSLTMDEAVADVMDAALRDTLDAGAAVDLTDDVTDTLAVGFSSSEQDTLYTMEDLSDSSRTFWEAEMLQAWFEADGDTTIFNPVWSNNGTCGGPATLQPSRFANMIACPPCVAAAIWGAGADILAGYSGIKNGQGVGSIALDVGVYSVVTGATAYASASLKITTRIGGFLHRLFGG